MYGSNGSQPVSNMNPLLNNASQHPSDSQNTDALQRAASRARQSAEQRDAMRNQNTVSRAASRGAQHSGNAHIGRNYQPGQPWPPVPHYIGSTSETSPHCGAQHWAQEAIAKVVSQLLYSMCCHPLQATPPVLDSLLQGNTPVSRAFLKQTQKHDAAFRWPPQVRTQLIHCYNPILCFDVLTLPCHCGFAVGLGCILKSNQCVGRHVPQCIMLIGLPCLYLMPLTAGILCY